MTLSFMKDATNITYQALIGGHSVLFRTASEMLGKLAAIDSGSPLWCKLHLIDKIGYPSYSNRMPIYSLSSSAADTRGIAARGRGPPSPSRLPL